MSYPVRTPSFSIPRITRAVGLRLDISTRDVRSYRVDMSSAVRVEGLEKAYGEVKAVRGVSFEIEIGEVFGLLGPNGAGKTTTVEILEGYRTRDAGLVEVLGVDPATAGADWRERIGVVLQSGSLYAQLTVVEILRLFGGYYERSRDVDEVIGIVGLEEKRRAARAHALGRTEAPARSGPRPRRRPGARLSRRADDGVRPGSSPSRLGHDPLAPGPRQDDPPHDALPRRGRATLRPRRRAARRRDRRARPTGRADWSPAADRDPLPAATARRSSSRPRSRPGCCTS